MIDLKRGAEASRYALLRRLAPAMRHQLAGSFQPVTMMVAIIEKRLKAVSPDLPAVAKTSSDVRALASAAHRASLDLMGWIAPDPEATVPLDTGIDDALNLLATELSFRGFRCVNETGGVTTPVALHHIRGTAVAALLALTDAAPSQANVRITAEREGDVIAVTMALTELATALNGSQPDEFKVSLASYRQIEWDDVRAMAAADDVVLMDSAMTCVLRLPIVSG